MNNSDYLALARTKLANERTFLAYFRTFAVFLSSGIAVIKVEALHSLMELGYFFISASLIIITIGIVRFFLVRKTMRKMLSE